MTELATLYDRNSEFARTFTFADLPIRPKLSTVVLTCLDARVDPAHFLGLEPGEILVLRNAGGRVTKDVERDVTFLWTLAAQMADGGTPDLSLAIIHHTDCGVERLASAEARQGVSAKSGIAVSALEEIAICDHADALQVDVERLRSSALVPEGLVVSGHLYDPKSGRLSQAIAPERIGRIAGNGGCR